jgi:hypothetical protein
MCKTPKSHVVFVAGQSKGCSYGILSLTVIFRHAVRRDAAEDVANAIRKDYGDVADYTERARKLRDLTGGTFYWYESGYCDDNLELHFQANTGHGESGDPSGWYGARIEGGGLTPVVAAMLTKIAKLPHHVRDDARQLLAALGAVPVKYADCGSGVYVDADLAAELQSPKERSESEARAKAESESEDRDSHPVPAADASFIGGGY